MQLSFSEHCLLRLSVFKFHKTHTISPSDHLLKTMGNQSLTQVSRETLSDEDTNWRDDEDEEDDGLEPYPWTS